MKKTESELLSKFRKFTADKIFLLTGLIIILLLSFFVLPGNFFAQIDIVDQGLEVSPPSQEIEADPGETQQFEIRIRNTSDSSRSIQVRIEDFTAIGDQGQVALVEEGPWSVKSWARVEPSQFELEPASSQTVNITVNVPSDGLAGGRYGSVVFSTQSAPTAGETAATVAQEIASLFLVRISGPVNENMSIVEMTAPSFAEFGPIPLNLKFKNEGNVHVKATGLINVMDIFGRRVDDVVIQPTNVFPGAERVVTAQLDKKWLFGPYQALAIVYYGEGNDRITDFTTFFVFPIRLVAIIIIILVILYLLRKRIIRALDALFGK